MLVVVTRPQAQADTLAQRLSAQGYQVLVFPAIGIAPVTGARAHELDAALLHLNHFSCAIFVSANAIEHALTRLRVLGPRCNPGEINWPATVGLAVVGPGSLAALAAYGLAAPQFSIVSPPGTEDVEPSTSAQFDSESLLPQLLHFLNFQRETGAPARPILLIRGNGGRAWLAEQLSANGYQVVQVESYSRQIPEPLAEQWQPLCRLYDAGSQPVFVLTSSEAIANLQTLVIQRGGQAMLAWFMSSPVIAPHRRIAENATMAGFKQVLLSPPGDTGIASALELLRNGRFND